MICNSAVDSYGINAANREITTSTKTVRMKDILTLRKAFKYVENQTITMTRRMNNPTVWLRPDSQSLKSALADLATVKDRSQQLLDSIETSSYPHNAAKMANLKKISTRIDTLNKHVSAKFENSQQQVQFMRESEDRHRANQAESARTRFERRQHADQMISAGRGDELYNGGMVK